jgi:hypothetical protein
VVSKLRVRFADGRALQGSLCSRDYRDVVETLKTWRVLRSGIHVQ